MPDLADRLDKFVAENWLREDISDLMMDAADEIRRLHAENAELREGQPQAQSGGEL
jgi:hypothetical protein